MKKTIIGSLLFGALVFAAGSVNAQISDKMTVSGIITYQTASTTNAAKVVTLHTKSAAFNTKSLIEALNASTAFTNATGGVKITAGSWFTYDGTSVWVTNKSGANHNLTALGGGPYATVAISGSGVSTGSFAIDPTKGGNNQENTEANVTVTFNDQNGTLVIISGVGSDSVNATKTNASGKFHQVESFQVSGGGDATYKGNINAVSKGSVSGKGSGTL